MIWIDLENHHTVEGIIAEFFNRVRAMDPQAPSCAITNMDKNADNAISKAVDRILDVFKRGRYVLVLDLVESFGRPQMVHHGIPSSYKRITDQEDPFKARVDNLQSFLNKLLCIEKKENQRIPVPDCYWDSYVVVTADMPRHRYLRSTDDLENYQHVFGLVSSLWDINPDEDNPEHSHIHVHRPNSTGYEQLISENKLIPKYPMNPSDTLSLHWRCPSDSEDDSLKRTKDVLFLLDTLRLESKDDDTKVEKLKSRKATEAFICLLSLFRRPRSLPLLHSFVERWGLRKIENDIIKEKDSMDTHKAISELLRLIATAEGTAVGVVSQNHEGGSVWLFREVYESTYDALTEHIHRQEWINAWASGDSSKEPSSSAAIMDGVLSITWHLFAARTYYVDVFLPTHDIRAFWEYLYHRVSAIRTIVLLIAIIEKDIKKDEGKAIWKTLNMHCENLPSSYKNLLTVISRKLEPFEWYALIIGIFDPIKRDTEKTPEKISSAKDLVNHFKLLHKNSLDTLLMALNKNKLLFRAEAAPDSVLAWSDQFLIFEIKNMKLIKPNETFGLNDENNGELPDQNESGNTISELERQFKRLKYQALQSKMDYKSILKDYSSNSDFKFKENRETFKRCIKDLYGLEVELNNKKKLISKAKKYKNLEQKKKDQLVGEVAKAEKEFLKKFDVTKKMLNELFDITRCLVHPCDQNAETIATFILKTLSSIKTSKPDVESWIKRKQLIAYELRCRSRFKDWTFWQPLLKREDFDSQEEVEEREEILRGAEQDSIHYENLLRETTKTNYEDTKHRSTALTIRARALYLRGHFPQAHHFLDLASAGLFPERIDHWSLISVVYIVRAELLAISAHEHYFSLSEPDQVQNRMKELKKKEQLDDSRKLPKKKQDSKNQANFSTQDQILELKDLPKECRIFSNLAKELQPIAASSLKKIKRAEQELGHSEKLLRSMAHQNIWLIHMEFGWAQVRIERMLFEMELLFLSWKPLSVTEYLKKSGKLEQTILDAMQRLRNVLDIIPYQSRKWDEMQENKPDETQAGRSMFKLECNVLELWRQLFVVGAYYSSLLSCLYIGTGSFHLDEKTTVFDIADQLIPYISRLAGKDDNDETKYREQWKLWCIAMRFDSFGHDDHMKTFKLIDLQSGETLKCVSFRAAVITAMENECALHEIENMWNIRRGRKR